MCIRALNPYPLATYPLRPLLEAEPTQLPTHQLQLRLVPGMTAPQPQATFGVASWGWNHSCDRETKKGQAQGERG